MNLFFKLALTAITSALLLVGGIFAGENLNQPIASSQQSFGSFSPVQGQTYTLQGAGVTATQNTIPLASFTTPDGRAITMAMFGGTIGYGTLEPNTNSKIEDVTFSGVTQNANGTALLTGVTRGNDFVTPFAASTTLSKAHAGGSFFILSNTAGFYGQQFLFANNNGTSTANLAFTSTFPPHYDTDPIWGNFSTQVLADVSYVNSVVAAGAANASETVKGIIQLATNVQLAAGTSLGSTAARLGIPNSLATSTPTVSCTNGCVPVAVNGKLSQLFLDLTQAFNVSGLWTFSATTTFATTTAASSTITTLNVGTIGTPGVLFDYQPFTASGTWTKPAGLTGNEMVVVQAWGAGGGGGGGTAGGGGAGGGGGTYSEIKLRASDLGSTVTVTIGAAGTGTTGSGGIGGSTTFGTLLTAFGGGGGQVSTGANTEGGGGGGGVLGAGSSGSGATGGAGGSPAGGAATVDSGFGGGGGSGGNSAWGGGGGGQDAAGTSGSSGGATLYGGGGGGGGGTSVGAAGGTSKYGGNGGAGTTGVGTGGTAPAGGGGGGATNGATGGAGARGEVRVWVIK